MKRELPAAGAPAGAESNASGADLARSAIFGGLILACVALLYKEFMVLAFDPVLAETLRLPVRALEYLLLALIAVAIVVSIQAVGVALMLAVLDKSDKTSPDVFLTVFTAALTGLLGLFVNPQT